MELKEIIRIIYWILLFAYIIGAILWTWAVYIDTNGWRAKKNTLYSAATFIFIGAVVFGLGAVLMWEHRLWN